MRRGPGFGCKLTLDFLLRQATQAVEILDDLFRGGDREGVSCSSCDADIHSHVSLVLLRAHGIYFHFATKMRFSQAGGVGAMRSG